ncbi:choice-of-anchor J domain-containing protein [Lewinella sp. LCG006]|uniref:T9SS-dependent choice-of-anchor J family protein n=1 Tax=Lewinella sp. LCG006 TaxID=3231911 RepID=UPI00345F219A
MKNLLFVCMMLFANLSFAQILEKPAAAEIASLPQWAQLMYEDDPNVFAVDAAFQAYYRERVLEKSYHTQYYKKWRKTIDAYIQADGHYALPTEAEVLQRREQTMRQAPAAGRSGSWTLLGPVDSYNTDGDDSGQHTNIYCLDQSLSDPSVLYSGTEPGEIYRSNDEGETWFNVSLNDPLTIGTGIDAIKIHPTNPELVLAGSGSFLFRSEDGGTTWTVVLSGFNRVTEIAFMPSMPDVVLMSTFNGVFRSTDAGIDWDLVSPGKAWDLKLNTSNDQIVFLAKSNTAQNLSEFYRSTDGGLTFTIQTDGWHTSTDPGRNDGGVRLAVSDADPDRVYAHLIGESKTGDSGFIGLYRSDDGGLSWTLPNGPAGGPYDENHINLAVASVNWSYHQGYYNCALMCSNTNPDELLVGGLSLYKSTDGGNTFTALAGYAGGPYRMHVDMQDFRSIGTTSWITTDGGIYRSTDFFSTDGFDIRMTGIHGSDYWGFGQGWNEDVTVGGLYHNGVLSSFDNWAPGDFLQLGGGEPASGYVNPGEGRRVYSTQVGGRILPLEIGEPVTSFQFGINPNESYWGVQSTELEFDPRSYYTAYTGKDHQLWRSNDLGVTFDLFATFGNNIDDRITYIEIAWSAPSVMYVCQQMNTGNLGRLWKTTDAGNTWQQLTLPVASNTRKMLVQVDPLDENIVYIAFQSTGNGQRIYKSEDGGLSWTNLTTPILNNQNGKSIAVCGGTDGGIYYATSNSIYYRNNSMSDWEHFADGLPVEINTNIIRPFYRDSKIRLASYGKGVWESPLFEAPSRPVAQVSVDRFVDTVLCEIAPFRYVDHSIIDHAGASWSWTFAGGTPATSADIQAEVTYDTPGTYLTTLTVTDAQGNSDTDSLYISIAQNTASPILSEDFEGSFPPSGFLVENPDNGITWQAANNVGGFNNSSRSMMVNNFDYFESGELDDIMVALDLSGQAAPFLTFDVAYTLWGGNYSDSLEVLLSTDCGLTLVSEYFKGGADLATRPAQDSPFTPSGDEWRTDTIDLSAYAEYTDVLLIFRNHTGFGNNLYVDNINLHVDPVTATEALPAEAVVELYPNPVIQGEHMQIKTPYQEDILIDIFSADGKMVYRKKHAAVSTLDTTPFSKGAYLCIIRSEKQIRKALFVVD